MLIISNGKIMEKNIQKNRFTIAEIMQLLREKDVFDISQVHIAILENNGDMSLLLKEEYQPLIKKDLHVTSSSSKPTIPVELVVDGQIIYENLIKIGKDGRWLMNQLQKKAQVQSLQGIFYVVMETGGELYIDKRKDE